MKTRIPTTAALLPPLLAVASPLAAHALQAETAT